MTRKIRKIVWFLVIAAQVLPMGVFASVQNVSDSVNSQAPASEVQLVRVVTVKPSQTVVPLSLPLSKNFGCSLNTVALANLPQNAQTINLNQPASCFNLVPAAPAVLPKLAVVPIPQTSTVAAPSSNNISNPPAFSRAPFTQPGALPSLVFTVLGVILFEQKKFVKTLILRHLENINLTIVLSQMEVLRC